jgi:hypothetical protein
MVLKLVKIAVTLAGKFFREAERSGKQLRISQPTKQALTLRDSERVTEQLNALYSEVHGELDPELELEQIKLLRRSQW